jgi:hypothetical protein
MDKQGAETIEESLTDATIKLLEMARNLSSNSISDNCVYILSEYEKTGRDFSEHRKIRKLRNDKKEPKKLAAITPALIALYPICEINLFIYKSDKNSTTIELECYKNASAPTANKKAPAIHCKVAIPPYIVKKNKKFDINWEHDAFLIKWKMLLKRAKFKLKLIKLSDYDLY